MVSHGQGAAQQILRSFSRIRVEAAALEAAVNVVETELALNSLTSAAWTQAVTTESLTLTPPAISANHL